MEEMKLLARYLLAPLAAGALALVLLAGCAGIGGPNAGGSEPAAAAVAADHAEQQGSEAAAMNGSDVQEISAVLNGTNVTIELADTDAARAFAQMLPLELSLGDLNGNEKYAYLDEALPVAASNPGRIEAGDVMLFGDDCLVVFYESFNTSYRYTRIGRVSDPSALAVIASASSVLASFA